MLYVPLPDEWKIPRAETNQDMSRIVSIQLGRIRSSGRDDAENPQEKTWTTATFKEPVEGPVLLKTGGFAGDTVADRRFHGGPDKAVLVYSHDHYPCWLRNGFSEPLPPGAIGLPRRLYRPTSFGLRVLEASTLAAMAFANHLTQEA